MRRVIANTTPLIALANIDRLELLHELYGTIIVPQAVVDENKDGRKACRLYFFAKSFVNPYE